MAKSQSSKILCFHNMSSKTWPLLNKEILCHILEKEIATHSSVLAWRIPVTGEPGGLPSMWSQSRTRLKQLSSAIYIISTSSGSDTIWLPNLTSHMLQLLPLPPLRPLTHILTFLHVHFIQTTQAPDLWTWFISFLSLFPFILLLSARMHFLLFFYQFKSFHVKLHCFWEEWDSWLTKFTIHLNLTLNMAIGYLYIICITPVWVFAGCLKGFWVLQVVM